MQWILNMSSQEFSSLLKAHLHRKPVTNKIGCAVIAHYLWHINFLHVCCNVYSILIQLPSWSKLPDTDAIWTLIRNAHTLSCDVTTVMHAGFLTSAICLGSVSWLLSSRWRCNFLAFCHPDTSLVVETVSTKTTGWSRKNRFEVGQEWPDRFLVIAGI